MMFRRCDCKEKVESLSARLAGLDARVRDLERNTQIECGTEKNWLDYVRFIYPEPRRPQASVRDVLEALLAHLGLYANKTRPREAVLTIEKAEEGK